jgi:hypothetical protein
MSNPQMRTRPTTARCLNSTCRAVDDNGKQTKRKWLMIDDEDSKVLASLRKKQEFSEV